VRVGRWPQRRMSWFWLTLLFVGAAAHFASYDFRHQPIFTDVSYYLYYADQTSRGAVPYVDYFEIKTPGVIFGGMILQWLGRMLGVEPLYAVRVGYLVLAAAAATAMAVVCVRLSNNRPLAGWICLLCYCGFNLLGTLPAIGNVPKMISILSTGLALLALYDRHWLWAGACAGLAALDWQVSGVLTFVAVCLGALLNARRWRNLAVIVLGTVLAWIPVFVYFLWKGALFTFVRMVTWGALHKAASEEITFVTRLGLIRRTVEAQCTGEMWLLALAGLGLISFLVRLVRQRRGPALPLFVALGLYTLGVLVFSLVDFQARIDLFLALHVLALFAALPLVDVFYTLVGWVKRHSQSVGRHVHGAAAVVVVSLLVLLIRPSFLRGGSRVDMDVRDQVGATLADQQEVAGRFADVVGVEPVAVVRYQELLYLSGVTSGTEFVSWNLGTYSHYRQEGEAFLDTLARLLRTVRPGAIVVAEGWLTYLHRTPLGWWMYKQYRPLLLTSENDRYQVVVWYRRDLPPPTVRGVYFLDPQGLIEQAEQRAHLAQ
jgi:hypothetical protein